MYNLYTFKECDIIIVGLEVLKMKVENYRKEKNKLWSVDVDGNNIKVENENFVKLFVNDKLQDIIITSVLNDGRLRGKLPNGKEVKAILGGSIKMHCYIFVDSEAVVED